MKANVWSYLTGLIFGVGLILAGMDDPAKVIGFLDLFGGAWDPSLAFVMGANLVANGASSANGRPWSDALGAGEIEVDGTLVTASFPTEDARLWNGIVLQRDSLLATR